MNAMNRTFYIVRLNNKQPIWMCNFFENLPLGKEKAVENGKSISWMQWKNLCMCIVGCTKRYSKCKIKNNICDSRTVKFILVYFRWITLIILNITLNYFWFRHRWKISWTPFCFLLFITRTDIIFRFVRKL